MMRVDAMMANQTHQRGAIAAPVELPQFVGNFRTEIEMLGQIGRHGPVDMRKDVRARIVQRVVQIEDPRSAAETGLHCDYRLRISVPTP